MKSEFIKLAIKCDVLKFGSFTLKSGRVSPYFFNAGLFYTGQSLQEIGRFYAEALIQSKIEFEHIFGPAYKGLPLGTATGIALAEKGVNSSVTFNRKEIKDHGEGGQLIGSPLTGKTVIIDDVITAGTAFRESQQLIIDNGGELTGVVIALDRREKGQKNTSAILDIQEQGIEVVSIISLFDIINYLEEQENHSMVLKLRDYHAIYGV
jgi:orotate phosphoribosyltransferase